MFNLIARMSSSISAALGSFRTHENEEATTTQNLQEYGCYTGIVGWYDCAVLRLFAITRRLYICKENLLKRALSTEKTVSLFSFNTVIMEFNYRDH